MTVETTTTIAGPYPTNGVATAFPFSFRALSAGEVQVVREVGGVEVTVSPSLYKVQLSAQSGTVVFDAPPAAGANIYVLSDPDFKQNISFSNQSAFLPSSHNEANDRSAIRAQVLAEQVKRAPVLPLDPSKAAGMFPKVLADGSWGYEPAGPGATGPANSTYTTRRKLEQAPVTNRSYNFAPDTDNTSGWPAGAYFFTPGDFSGAQYAADFTTGQKVKLDAVPLNTGALVRQDASGVTFRQVGAAAVARSSRDKSREVVSANDFGAVGDNATDCTAAINAAILELCKRGGGRVVFGSADAYYVSGTVIVPSNIHVDLSGETLRGGSGDLFQSGYFTGSAVLSNVNDGPEVNIVQNASIRNGNIINAKRCWNLKNWNQKATIENIKTRDCAAVGYYKRCFSMSLIDIDARGGSSVTIPTHDFFDQTNSVKLDRVKCVTEWGMRFAGGSNVVDLRGCEFEGGTKGVTFEGDNLAVTFDENYFEALGQVGIDASGAGACSFNIRANYFNQVLDAFRHGTGSTATLHGIWTPDNELVNTAGGAKPNMRVMGPRNFIDWYDRPVDDQTYGSPSNWIVDKQTRYHRDQRWNASFAGDDLRAVAVNHGPGIVPRTYGGDTGEPFFGTVPFSSYTLPAGASVSATLTTNITVRDNSAPILFVIAINDNVGPKKVSGIIFGNFVFQAQGTDRPVLLSQDAQGRAVLSIGAINNGNGAVALTGTVRLI